MMEHRTNKCLIITLILFIAILSTVQAEPRILQLTNLNGLSNNSVNCIFQDSENTMWFGTWDGLTSFNSRDFDIYRYSKDSTSISNNVIRQIVETDNKHLWIATDYGINRWNRKSKLFDRYFTEENSILPKEEKGFLIAQTTNKELIALVNNKGIYYFNNKLDKFVRLKNLSNNYNINKLIIDNNNYIHILYNNGLLKSYILSKDKEALTSVNDIITDYKNKIDNIFYTNNFLVLYTNKTLKIIDNNNQYPSTIETDHQKHVSDVIFSDRSFIISYLEGGCKIYDPKNQSLKELPDISNDVPIFTLFNGNQNILWIGTDAQGVYQRYNYKSAFITVNTNYPVRSITDYNENELLIGTKGGGLELYNKKTKSISSFANTKDGLSSNSVYSLKKNKNGDIFIGSDGSSLSIINKDKHITTLKIPISIEPYFKSVYSLMFTNNDSVLWAGTSGNGLLKIVFTKDNNKYIVTDIKRFSTSNDNKNYNNDIIYSIAKDTDSNKLWIATRRSGLFLFDIHKERFENVKEINKNLIISNNDVLSLLKDNETLWIGTSYGLNSINVNDVTKSNIVFYDNLNGLENNTIHEILKNKNVIWVSTNRGLSSINLTNNTITNYTKKDGLQNNEFSDGAAYKDKNDIFYFGGVSGFNLFDPDKIELRTYQSSIKLSNLKIFNTQVNQSERIKNKTLHLSYNEVYTTLTFLSQDYINNENSEYAYRFSNLSDQWINNGQNPNIVLTNLSPGKYHLQVKATNGDRIWSPNIYTLTIDVGYPWWLSLPAILLYIILTVIIIYISYSVIKNRIRLNKQILLEHIEQENQKKIHESKLDFFTNVAHEFFTPLTLIYGPAQHLLDRPNLDSYTKRYIKIIKNNADRMQKLISELMDFRKAESGHTAIYPQPIDLQLLIKYIADNYTELAKETDIDFNIETKNISTFISDRNSLERIIFNLLSNAFKYTPAYGYVRFNLEQTDNKLTISVKNSGKGLTNKQQSEIFNKFKIFDNLENKNAKSTGIGLSLVKSIVELIGGSISVDSKINEYVEFTSIIPPLNISEGTKNEESLDPEIIQISIKEQKNVSILIVEDEKDIRKLLNDTLQPYYSITEAIDGKDALEKIANNEPDIIISDILMPNLDGIGLITRLKENKKTAHIPIINISAKDSLDDKINAYEHGADLYITKPFHPRHLLATIQSLINKQINLKEYYNSGLSSMSVTEGKDIHKEDKNLLQDIISYIENNIEDESLNPNSLAEILGISKASLYRKLEELTEKTPSEFIRHIKLNHASNLLIATKMTVQEIMFKSGFTNKSYFYREFAKVYGSSPLEYRQKNTSI